MKSKWKLCVGAAAALTGFSVCAEATPIVDYKIVGNTDGSSTYTSAVSVAAGDVVHYEILASIADLGTTSGSKTVNSLTQGTDGIITSAFNVVNTTPANISGTFSAATLVSNAQGPSSSGGTAATDALTGVKIAVDTTAGNPPFGVTADNTPGYQLLLSGTFSVTAVTSGATTLGETYASAGSFKINTGQSTFVSSATLDAQYNNFAPLTVSAIPEPATLSVAGFAVIGLFSRRARRGLSSLT